MKPDNLRQLYFVGIGGIGMSALARYFRAAGKKVAGYDRTATDLTRALVAEGIEVGYDEDPEKIPGPFRDPADRKNTLVVVTPAVPAGHAGLRWFRDQGYAVMKRAELLGRVTAGSRTVAVAGTHGKTTTTSMAAHLLHAGGIPCTSFLGGISKNFGSNLLLAPPGEDPVMVVEADEYDRSFLQLTPDVAVITSMDPDHLDIYGDSAHLEEAFRQFAERTRAEGTIVYRSGLRMPAGRKTVTYATEGPADFHVRNLTIRDHRYAFDLVHPGGVIDAMTLALPGRHNLENAVAASAAALAAGLAPERLRKALETYDGVYRRFDFRLRDPRVTFVDDYAHHPAEIRACLEALREWYPGRKITGIFQPHLFSRTRDFAGEFAAELSRLDELILLDIYPAREAPIPGITSGSILDRVTLPDKALCSREALLDRLRERPVDVLVTLGAGDIDQLVDPIRNLLIETYHIESCEPTR